jgi:hypothetical protein
LVLVVGVIYGLLLFERRRGEHGAELQALGHGFATFRATH